MKNNLIKLTWLDGEITPNFCCIRCGKIIKDASMANILFRLPVEGGNDYCDLMAIHKLCDQGHFSDWLWLEMREFLQNLVWNSNYGDKENVKKWEKVYKSMGRH